MYLIKLSPQNVGRSAHETVFWNRETRVSHKLIATLTTHLNLTFIAKIDNTGGKNNRIDLNCRQPALYWNAVSVQMLKY